MFTGNLFLLHLCIGYDFIEIGSLAELREVGEICNPWTPSLQNFSKVWEIVLRYFRKYL